jgi:hypothetical protein
MAKSFVYSEKDAYWYLNLTDEQQSSYNKFRKDLFEEKGLVQGLDDQLTLLRFLKARQWDVGKAKLMYSAMAAWRKSENVEEIHEHFTFPELEFVLPYYQHFYQ